MNHHGYDGQLGCAAVTFRNDAASGEQEIVRQLEKWLLTSEGALPAYTVPRFLRVLVDSEGADQIGMSGGDTGKERVSMIMKKLKTGLRKEG